MEASPRKRVKVYELNGSSEWIDKGTGQCVCSYVERKAGLCLNVRSEDNGALLLESKILPSDVYQRQQDTLIVWTEPEGLDLALSFQEAAGCNEIWEQIMDIQKRMSHEELFEEGLPKPELGNLNQIEQVIHQISLSDRDKLAQALLQDNYYSKLLDLFEVCEDLENTEGLQSLFYIMRSIMMLNNRQIYEPLFKEDNILKVLGILEYDPEVTPKPNHRDRVVNHSAFRQAIPLPDKEIEKKIHQTYRMQYLKNHVLPRGLDENAFSVLHQMIYLNYASIVTDLQKDEQFLNQLFRLLTDKDVSDEKMGDGIDFIQEFCLVAKSIQENRPIFYRALCKHGFLYVLAPALESSVLKIRLACTDIIFSVLEHDVGIIRSFILAQENLREEEEKDKKTLFATLVQQFIDDPDMGMKTNLSEILRSLLDSENSEGANPAERAEFISLFYEKYMSQLIEPLKVLATNTDPNAQFVFDIPTSSLYNYICELLCFFVHQHTYQIKSFILRNNVLAKSQLLLRAKEKYLALACIRFFRAVIALKDDTFNGHIIQNKLFEPLFKVFETQKSRNNLVNSALLDLFEFIRHENLKKLISHIVDNYSSYFQGITYVDTFRLLVLKNDQNKELLQNGYGPSIDRTSLSWTNPKRKREERDLDEDEEAYFKDEDEENGSHLEIDAGEREYTPPLPNSALVNYDDEEESGVFAQKPDLSPSQVKKQKAD